MGSEINRSAAYQTEWIHCPVCSNKTPDKINKISVHRAY
ncbi:cysteine-rich KTR domain-containing protein [Enterocloster clostridioformis]